MPTIRSYILCLMLALSACRDHALPEQSFYYWKTVFRLSSSEAEVVAQNWVNRLYIHYFDVIDILPGKAESQPNPDATVIFKDDIPTVIEVIPVIFIVNDALAGLPADSIDLLAGRICKRIGDINRGNSITKVPEIQMDCDWNATTRDRYFALLTSVRRRMQEEGKLLSATLRLHQVKYSKTSGIPPVDRVTLMCYNMGRLTGYDTRNSILDAETAQSYVQGLKQYPLPVDVALPLFNWGVCFRNQTCRGLISNLCDRDMQQPYFTKIASNMYRADTSLVLRNAYIRKGDHIRIEDPAAEEIRKVVRIVAEQVKNPGYVIWYHLDSLLLQKHPCHELQETVDLFH